MFILSVQCFFFTCKHIFVFCFCYLSKTIVLPFVQFHIIFFLFIQKRKCVISTRSCTKRLLSYHAKRVANFVLRPQLHALSGLSRTSHNSPSRVCTSPNTSSQKAANLLRHKTEKWNNRAAFRHHFALREKWRTALQQNKRENISTQSMRNVYKLNNYV